MFEVRMEQEGHQGHLVGVFGDAFLSSLGGPCVSQFKLESFGEAERLKDGLDSIRHGRED